MSCLEWKKGNLSENYVQIEVEPIKIENTHNASLEIDHIDAVIPNENELEAGEYEQSDNVISPLEGYQLTRDRKRRQIRPPHKYNSDDFVSLFTFQEEIESVTNSYNDALKSKDSNKWLAVMEEEMVSLYKNKT